MNIEYEATFANIEKDDIRTRLAKVGAALERVEFLQKRYTFDVPDTCRLSNAWVRVRDEGNRATLTLKDMPSEGGTIDDQKELEVIVSDYDEAVAIMRNMGLVEKAYQESRREIWLLDDVEIMIDEWPWLEPFVEIEGVGEQVVKNVSQKLGFEWEDAIFGAVCVQYKRKYGVSHEVINFQTKRFVFGEPNPFE